MGYVPSVNRALAVPCLGRSRSERKGEGSNSAIGAGDDSHSAIENDLVRVTCEETSGDGRGERRREDRAARQLCCAVGNKMRDDDYQRPAAGPRRLG